MNWFLPSFVSKTLKTPLTPGFAMNSWQNKGNPCTSRSLLILYLLSLGILQKKKSNQAQLFCWSE